VNREYNNNQKLQLDESSDHRMVEVIDRNDEVYGNGHKTREDVEDDANNIHRHIARLYSTNNRIEE